MGAQQQVKRGSGIQAALNSSTRRAGQDGSREGEERGKRAATQASWCPSLQPQAARCSKSSSTRSELRSCDLVGECRAQVLPAAGRHEVVPSGASMSTTPSCASSTRTASAAAKSLAARAAVRACSEGASQAG